jgi:4-alpha-glucanotransferase
MGVPQVTFEKSTSYDDALSRAASDCGIDREYWDIFNHRHEIAADSISRILIALRWDISSVEKIDEQRLYLFLENATSISAKTLVISESEKSVRLALPFPANGSLGFRIALEGGETLAGAIDAAHLREVRQVVLGDRRWSTVEWPLPNETPLGYHNLTLTVNGESTPGAHLIVCPDRAYLPRKLEQGGKTAGFNVALYGLRSSRNWGCGDFTDLRAVVEWAHGDLGFNLLGLNPLHALHNRVPYNTSPYLPLSIYYKNLIYVDIERVPEFESSRCAQGLLRSPQIQKKIDSARQAEFVEYEEVASLKGRFLKLLYHEFTRRKDPERTRAFADYCVCEGDLLDKFALYCALDEILHKQDRRRWTWRDWPEEYQSADSAAAREFARRHMRTVEFYKYVQFVIDEQLCAAQRHAKTCGMEIGLYHDLAVATDSCGADLWAHRNFFVNGCRVGAPPDDFSPNGQDWSFPPPDARVHRDSGYRLYRASIRKIVAHGGALRIDHVMRLFRLFWIPNGLEARDGAYVRDYAIDLMRILALESVRAENIIVGEDLGTVTDEIRDMLSRFRILSYRLFYFEKHSREGAFRASAEYPRQALVSSATHDLPTLAGFWLARDIEARRAAGLADEQGYRDQMHDRHREKQGMLDALHAEHLLPEHFERNAENVPDLNGDLHNAIVGFLARMPSMILLLNHEDFTKETDQQNLPGSTAEYPNWRRKMKVAIEDLRSGAAQPFARMFRDQLRRSGR